MAIYEEKPHKISQLEVEQIHETEAVINELEGQRVFGSQHYEFWLISIIALAWSLFQLYIVIEPTNSTISRSIHLSFGIVLAFFIYPMMRRPYFLKKIRWFGYTFAAIGLVTASYIALFYNEISLRPGDYTNVDIIIAITKFVVFLDL